MSIEPTPTSETPPTRLDPAEICTLPPRDRADRIAWVRGEILPHAAETMRLEDGLAIELNASPALVEKVDRLIALERECCAGIRFERHSSATPGRVRFEIHGVDPNASMLRALGAPEANSANGARVATAAGAGLALSLFVCCIVPIAAGALVGAAAAPLAALDGPIPIAAGSLVGGAGAWLWLGRRRRTAAAQKLEVAESACGKNC